MYKKLTVLCIAFLCAFALHYMPNAQARGYGGHSSHSTSHSSHSKSYSTRTTRIKGINSGSGIKTSNKLKFYKPTKTGKYLGMKVHTISTIKKNHMSIRKQRYKPFYKHTRSIKQSGVTIHMLVRGHMTPQYIQ